MTQQIQKTQFEYETQEQYYEEFVKRNFTFEIDIRPIDEAEVKTPKEYNNGSLDLPKHYNMIIKDKVSGKKVTVDKLLRERFKLFVLETQRERKMNPLEYVLRQRTRFDGKTEVFSIRRPKENSNIITRFLKPNEKASYAPELYIYITLYWIGCGLHGF